MIDKTSYKKEIRLFFSQKELDDIRAYIDTVPETLTLTPKQLEQFYLRITLKKEYTEALSHARVQPGFKAKQTPRIGIVRKLSRRYKISNGMIWHHIRRASKEESTEKATHYAHLTEMLTYSQISGLTRISRAYIGDTTQSLTFKILVNML